MKKMLITPELAAELIASREYRHRTVSKKFVNHLVKEIRAGNWKIEKAAPILLDRDNLFDGLQRLTAIVEAGQAVECYVSSDGSI